MPERLTKNQIGNVGKPRPIFVHGKLLPIEVEYWKWADKDKEGNKIEGTKGVVPYAKWVQLPENKRGQKWFIKVDQRIYRPDFEKETQRSVMVDFDDWNAVVAPGILDAVGMGPESYGEFVERADSENWYVEAELIYTGMYNDKPQNQFRFTRMTQNAEENKAWYAEKHPQEELVIPDEVLERLKTIYNVMTKGTDQERIDKFNTIVNGDEELSPYLLKAAENGYALIKG